MQAIDQLLLCWVDLFAGNGRRKPGTSVNLGKGEPTARATRPFRFHRIAGDPIRIGIAFPRPGMYYLTGLLANGTQRDERTYWLKAGLFPKFSAGGGQQLLTRLS